MDFQQQNIHHRVINLKFSLLYFQHARPITLKPNLMG